VGRAGAESRTGNAAFADTDAGADQPAATDESTTAATDESTTAADEFATAAYGPIHVHSHSHTG